MELTNTELIHSSDRCTITFGEFEGDYYVKKVSTFSRDAIEEIAKINSPYISMIHEIGENYIIYEYADGSVLSEKPIPAKKVYDIAIELCNALIAFHERKIIHRDIKPSNIILCSNGHIKLIDFDAARIMKPTSDKDTRFIGTDGFAPPEQYGFMQTDERSDIYSFGITIKLLLRDSYAHCPYKSVIDKCTRFNPEQRFSSINAVKSALKYNKLLPYILIPSLGTITASLILALNFSTNRELPVTDNTNSKSCVSSSDYAEPIIQSSITSSVSQSSTSLIAVSSSSNSAVSSSSFSTSSSISSSKSLVSSSNSHSTSHSVSSAAQTASTQISDSSSITSNIYLPFSPSSEPIEIPMKTEYNHNYDWNTLTLPDGFPTLTNSYDGFLFTNTDNNNIRYLVSWYNMSEQELEKLARAAYEYFGSSSKIHYSYNSFEKSWVIELPQYYVSFTIEKGDSLRKFLVIRPKTLQGKYPAINFENADQSICSTTARGIEWNSSDIPSDLPKLSETFSSCTYYADGAVVVYYSDTSYYEALALAKKTAESLDDGYTYEVQNSGKAFFWRYHGKYNGTPVNIEIVRNNDNYSENTSLQTTIIFN